MRFLLDANMPRSAATLLRELGHEVEEVCVVLPPGATDAVVAARAKASQQIMVTRDFDFADIRNYPPSGFPGIIVLALPDDAVASQVNGTLQCFVVRTELLGKLAGRLAIVESWRVRFRPHDTAS